MSGIDFSKAPDGATHYREDWHCTSTGGIQYYKLDRAGWEYWAENIGSGWRECDHPVSGFSEMPAKADLPWTGEGLPPVGRCELRMISAGGDWHVADIKFASRNVVVWDWEDEPAINGLCSAYVHTVQFRPIRTPEQIAAEAREHAIKDLMQLDDIYHEQAAAIYDAGYRKVSP